MEPSGTWQQHGPGVQGAAVLRCFAVAVKLHIIVSSATGFIGLESTSSHSSLPAAGAAEAIACYSVALAAPLMLP
jgi:hypothetical protein